MPTSDAYFFGGPCDGRGVRMTYERKPPATVTCRGVEYRLNPNARGALAYTTAEYEARYNASRAVAGQRDVFQAWARLLHTLGSRFGRRRQRLRAAGNRIRRAVR